jgi:hypothetical protein
MVGERYFVCQPFTFDRRYVSGAHTACEVATDGPEKVLLAYHLPEFEDALDE